MLPRSIVRDSRRGWSRNSWHGSSTAALLAPSVPEVKIISRGSSSRTSLGASRWPTSGLRTPVPGSSGPAVAAAGATAGSLRHGGGTDFSTPPGPSATVRGRCASRAHAPAARDSSSSSTSSKAGGRPAQAAPRVPGVRAAMTAGRGPGPPSHRRKTPPRGLSCCRSGWQSGPGHVAGSRQSGSEAGRPAFQLAVAQRAAAVVDGAIRCGVARLRSVVQRPRV